ncbi:nucleotide sugar dehydrogenase [candidate division KSB1 bacterium]|nr:MAG: nucleotide sugar dehydrogenase [candidate division KSB1 bacterium]
MFQFLLEKIKNKKVYIGIIGLGYVGLPLSREFLNKGFKVIGFDIDKEKVAKINKGESYIRHIDSEFIKKYVSSNSFSATNDFSRLKEVDVIIICVPTPIGKHYEPDLSFVLNTTKTITQHLRKGQLVILESTTYPGTTEEEILPILSNTGLKIGKDFFLGYSPEREDPGNKKFSTATIPKVVSGITEKCLALVNELYKHIVIQTVPVSSPRVAEATKILENTYRAVNIALVNELKIIFERMGIDIWEVIEAAKTKPFGFQAFYPGPGLGGHCIPIDPFYLTWKAKEYDIHTRFIELAGEVNSSMPYYVVEKTIKALNTNNIPVKGAKILLVGVAYKPDVDDMRESPALKIMDLLEKEGARVDYHDPYIPVLPKTRKYQFKKTSISLTPQNIAQYDAVVITTNHSNIDYQLIAEKAKLIIDTRNALKIKGIQKGKIWKA